MISFLKLSSLLHFLFFVYVWVTKLFDRIYRKPHCKLGLLVASTSVHILHDCSSLSGAYRTDWLTDCFELCRCLQHLDAGQDGEVWRSTFRSEESQPRHVASERPSAVTTSEKSVTRWPSLQGHGQGRRAYQRNVLPPVMRKYDDYY